MVIKAVMYTGATVLQSARGAVSVLTTTDPHTGLGGSGIIPSNGNHALKEMAWFEGRLWTMGQQNNGGYEVHARKYHSVGDWWNDAADSPGKLNLAFATYGGEPGTVGVFAYKDCIHFFWPYDTSSVGSSFIPRLARAYWQ